MNGHIFQLNCSDGGVPKLAVREAVLTPTGLIGDRQAHPKIHGGPERALQAEGHPIYPGSVGENVTVAGLDWATLTPGQRLALGEEVLIEITSYAGPCQNIQASFVDHEFKRISQKIHPGQARLYARVLQTGRLAVGQTVRVLESNGHQ
jgi:MOSC domain-containing protein YiiM